MQNRCEAPCRQFLRCRTPSACLCTAFPCGRLHLPSGSPPLHQRPRNGYCRHGLPPHSTATAVIHDTSAAAELSTHQRCWCWNAPPPTLPAERRQQHPGRTRLWLRLLRADGRRWGARGELCLKSGRPGVGVRVRVHTNT